jgi:hypothetical protein
LSRRLKESWNREMEIEREKDEGKWQTAKRKSGRWGERHLRYVSSFPEASAEQLEASCA